ncbi:MAG: hypothetical protein VYB61_05880 [Verrucomicrobiota bacterium]|nr:hypothetical protein [Verrucomicrobiota bacterium]
MVKQLVSLVGIIVLFATMFTLLVYIWLLNSSTIFERRESPAPRRESPAPPPNRQPVQQSCLQPEGQQRFADGPWTIINFPLASSIIRMR